MPKQTLPSAKEYAELQRTFKRGYRVRATRSGHFQIYDQHNKVVRHEGTNTPLQLPSSPKTGVPKALKRELEELGIISGSRVRSRSTPYSAAEQKNRREALKLMVAERDKARTKQAEELFDRLDKFVPRLGGWDGDGSVIPDLGHIAAFLVRTGVVTQEDPRRANPDLLMVSARRVRDKEWIVEHRQAVFHKIAELLEKAPDMVEEFFRLVREARGLPAEPTADSDEKIKRRRPKSTDWPFRVDLLELDRLVVDHSYQRPVPWPFVRKLAASFDDRLVGTIDVSERRHGAVFAILDGQLRFESMRLIGKQTVWASIYSGLDQQDEARFFLHKNKDRKAIHPYYTYKAKLTAGDAETVAITKLVEDFGFRVALTSAAHDERNISAITALELAYRREDASLNGKSGTALVPTLKFLKAATFGRKNGQHTTLIRGLGRFFAYYPEYDWDRLVEVGEARGPEWLLGRAKEEDYSSSSSQETNLMRVLVAEYNKGLPRGEQLAKPKFSSSNV